MNLIKTVGTPLQQMFAALAIFALVMMPMAQVFAEDALGAPAEVQGLAAPAAPEIPVETPEQKVVEKVAEPSEPAPIDLMTVSELSNCTADLSCVRPSITIVAEKIVCTDEADLPNWGNNIPVKIDGNTAANWLVDHESCKLASGWDFEWGLDNVVSDPGGTAVGTAGVNWHSFGLTDTDGETSTSILLSNLNGKSKIWLREVLKDNYLPFSDLMKVGSTPIGESVSAEFYCHTDGLNYDNYEWVDDIDAGETFHCVAWNVPKKGSITIEKKTIGDAKDWSFDFTGSLGVFTLTDGEGSTETFSNLTPGEYSFDEADEDGWDLTSVKCTDDVEPSSVALQTAVPAPTPDVVVTLDPGENVTCTFTNTEEPVQNSCLVPAGTLETFVVVPSSEKTLQTILTENSIAADVEDDQYNYQVWDFASGDTDTVTFEVKLLGGVAGNVQEFGYYNADTDAGFTPVGYTGSVTVPASVADSLGFAIRTTSGNVSKIWYSEKALNGGEDHVAAYNTDDNTYVLAFEDLALTGDKDYNDLVVQVKTTECTEKAKECTVTLTSGAENTTVVEKDDAFAVLLAPLHTGWTAFIAGASWIWGDNPVAAPVDGVAQTFVRKFGWAGLTVTDVKLYVAADNSYVATLNGDAAGLDAGEYNYVLENPNPLIDGQDEYDLANTIVDPGNNILSINVVNKPSSNDPAENPAGLMYKLVITGTGENCEIPYKEDPVDPEPTITSNGGGSSHTPRCEEKDFDLDDGVLSWKTKNGYDLSIEKNGDEIFTTDDRDEVKVGTLAVSSDSGDTFKLTVNRNSKKDTCTIELGSVLGDSTSRDGGVGGASTMMPAGAPAGGAGGTSPVVVTLPTLLAVLNARSVVRKS